MLDEEVYAQVKSVSDFIQTVPNEGAPATERTEAWVIYDDDNFYLSCRCWDSAPPEEWTANELRRDTNQLRQNDMFGALLDTFHDRRNGFNFYTNPLGARADQVVSNEGNPNADWNPVWFVRTGRFDGGWTVEMAIPFKSIRYRLGHGSGVGPADAARDPPQERVDAPDPRARRHRRRHQHLPRLGRSHAGRPRPAAGEQERRAQALWHLASSPPTNCARRSW